MIDRFLIFFSPRSLMIAIFIHTHTIAALHIHEMMNILQEVNR